MPWRVADNWGRWFLWREGGSIAQAFYCGENGAIAYFRTAEIAQGVADRLNDSDATTAAPSPHP